jgi:hypothetical protein
MGAGTRSSLSDPRGRVPPALTVEKYGGEIRRRKAMSRYYVREIERDWQPIEAESVEAAAERYVAEYAETAEGSTYWSDLVVRGLFFPRTAWNSERG